MKECLEGGENRGQCFDFSAPRLSCVHPYLLLSFCSCIRFDKYFEVSMFSRGHNGVTSLLYLLSPPPPFVKDSACFQPFPDWVTGNEYNSGCIWRNTQRLQSSTGWIARVLSARILLFARLGALYTTKWVATPDFPKAVEQAIAC